MVASHMRVLVRGACFRCRAHTGMLVPAWDVRISWRAQWKGGKPLSEIKRFSLLFLNTEHDFYLYGRWETKISEQNLIRIWQLGTNCSGRSEERKEGTAKEWQLATARSVRHGTETTGMGTWGFPGTVGNHGGGFFLALLSASQDAKRMEGEELRVLLYLTSYSMNRSMNCFSFF